MASALVLKVYSPAVITADTAGPVLGGEADRFYCAIKVLVDGEHNRFSKLKMVSITLCVRAVTALSVLL